MIERINTHFSPVFREGSALTTCTEKLRELIAKIQEYFTRVLQALCPCLFGGSPGVGVQVAPIPAVHQPEQRIGAVQPPAPPILGPGAPFRGDLERLQELEVEFPEAFPPFAPVEDQLFPIAELRGLDRLPPEEAPVAGNLMPLGPVFVGRFDDVFDPAPMQEVEAPVDIELLGNLMKNPPDGEAVPIENPDEILQNPYPERFPEDGEFIADGIIRAFQTIDPEKKELYKQQLANPLQQGEIDPYFWTAACSIVHYLCYSCWRHNIKCPTFLSPYNQNDGEFATLTRLCTRFTVLKLGQGILAKQKARADVVMKIRDPYKRLIESVEVGAVVEDVLKFAYILSRTDDFRNRLYPAAAALCFNENR